MAYNKSRAEKEWLKWKTAEEKKLRELGVDEDTIQHLHIYDWTQFNQERRYFQRQVEWTPYIDQMSAQELETPVNDIESLLNSIENSKLLKRTALPYRLSCINCKGLQVRRLLAKWV